jgi:hypothetical protein
MHINVLQSRLPVHLLYDVMFMIITSDTQGLFGASLSEKGFVGLESKAIDCDLR